MPEGSTPADVAAAIGPGLAKAALAAKVDGEVRDIMRPFEGDAQLAIDPRRQGGLGEARTDRRRHVGRRRPLRHFARGTVGQGDLEHL
jgi:hypothetical protein